MAYTVEIKNDVAKAIARLAPKMQQRVAAALRELANEPRPAGSAKIKGRDHTWRIRLGVIRIVYEIHDNILSVTVVRLAHRREVYRHL
ncbi:MAG: type II toxin-antitoxin system RelE/ParE family toxin [Planctomycetota bacterium]|jgi:mRNA interferase RelE/StbE|nr:type II toxin-antitoxin system RelE/ParE family toxin [Planctomycetota bacterium]